MGLSNAERQARWRQRQKAKHEARIHELEAALRNRPEQPEAATDAERKPGNEAEAYMTRIRTLNAVAKKKRNGPVEPKEVQRLWNLFMKMDGWVCALEKQAGFPDLSERYAKLQALAERPGTEGEGAAAKHHLKRLENKVSSKWAATAPKPLPKTVEEMLARKTPRKRK